MRNGTSAFDSAARLGCASASNWPLILAQNCPPNRTPGSPNKRPGTFVTLPPPPPPTSGGTRPIAFYDTECFPNYWLLKLRPRGGVAYAFRLRTGERFTDAQRHEIAALFEVYTTVSFNGLGYDVPMITAALCGYSPEELKALNDRIIPQQIKGAPKVYGAKPWELGLPEWAPADHIDIMEVAPGAGSQKQYAGRIHCKTMRDLPYSPFHTLTEPEIVEVDDYCGNDLDVLEALFDALAPQVLMRQKLSARYGIDLRSKSDAQVAETVLRKRCEIAAGRRIYKNEIDWGLQFVYKVPSFIAFELPQLRRALELVGQSVFRLGPSGAVEMPQQLEGLEIAIGGSVYKMGIGGLHSQEKKLVAVSDADYLIRMPDVASYYPSLILNSGEWPPALGPTFRVEYKAIKDERLEVFKPRVKELENAGLKYTPEWDDAKADDEGGKTGINGGFGKTGSHYSVMFAPVMLIQTTVTGQLSLLMLIEWHEHYGIPVISANTDGLVLKCPRALVATSEFLIAEWQKRTGLEMETDDYLAIYARDVNNYFAIKSPSDVKRKGEYAKAGLVAKKNPDVEICADAVSDFLAKGTPIIHTITTCRDLRKFVTIQAVAGGGVKMWGEGPRKGALVREMEPVLLANGWHKEGRKWAHWERSGPVSPGEAYLTCFAPQTPEYLGKVVRWYYSTQAPGPIVYATNGNTVSLSYGAQPCMTLPDDFPADVDFAWYIEKAEAMLRDIGFYTLTK